MNELEQQNEETSCDRFLPQEIIRKPKSYLKTKIAVAVFFIMILIYKVMIASRLGSFDAGLMWLIKDLARLAVFLVLVVLSLSFHTISHELGHALAGLSRGMQVVLLSIGRWRYERTVNGFRWRKSVPIQGIAGAAALMIDTTRKQQFTRFDFIVFLAGGVVVNLLFGGGFWMLAAQLTGSNVLSLALKTLFHALGFAGIFLGVLNALPLKTRGWYTDGLLIWQTLQGKGWYLNRRSLYLGSLLFHGLPPRLLPTSELPTWEELQEEGIPFLFKMSAHQLRLMFALDRRDQSMAEKSAAWLAEYFYQLPDGMRQTGALQMSFFAVRFLQSEEVFKVWRPLCEGGLYNLTVNKFQLDAEYACLCGDGDVVRKNIQKARETILELPTQAHVDEMESHLLCLERMACPLK